MSEYVVRFIAGGIVVSAFALLGDILRPKSFAGLFSAAPSVALVTLALAFEKEGAEYVGAEAQAMFFGSVALGMSGFLVCHLLMRRRWSALSAGGAALFIWFGVAASLLMIGTPA